MSLGISAGFTKPVGTGPGPVPVWAGTKPAQIQNSNLNSNGAVQLVRTGIPAGLTGLPAGLTGNRSV